MQEPTSRSNSFLAGREQWDFNGDDEVDDDDNSYDNANKNKDDNDKRTRKTMTTAILTRKMSTTTRKTTMRLLIDGYLVFDHECYNDNSSN